MPQTLTFAVDAGVQGSMKFRVRKIKFGDGYTQRQSDGLNNMEDTWPVSTSGRIATVQPLINFLETHKGDTSFYWTPPNRAQGLYVCEEYAVQNLVGDEVRVTATFVRSHKP